MAADAAVRDWQTALTLRLAKHLASANDSGGKNVVFSPVSVHAGLALVAVGARGTTQAQLLRFLGAPTVDGLAAFGRHVTDRVLADRAESGGPHVLFGSGVWVDASRGGLKKAFQEPEKALEMINSCVKKATNNLIDIMLSRSDITAETDLVLANAVNFKGTWLDPFNSTGTWSGKFHRLDGSHVQAQFMHKFEPKCISCVDGFKVLKLPYGLDGSDDVRDFGGSLFKVHRGGRATSVKASPGAADDTQFSMFVFLPDKPGGFADMVDAITAAPGYLYSVLPKEEAKLARIKLPKFEVSFDWDLGSDLHRLGLTLPFSPEEGGLRDMCEKDDEGARPLFLTKVAHKAVVKVNEEGTEATAVMTVLRGGGP